MKIAIILFALLAVTASARPLVNTNTTPSTWLEGIPSFAIVEGGLSVPAALDHFPDWKGAPEAQLRERADAQALADAIAASNAAALAGAIRDPMDIPEGIKVPVFYLISVSNGMDVGVAAADDGALVTFAVPRRGSRTASDAAIEAVHRHDGQIAKRKEAKARAAASGNSQSKLRDAVVALAEAIEP